MRPAAQYLSLASPRERHQREGDPAVRDPFAALRGNLRCALQAGSAQTRLAAQTARGPDPPEAVLLGTDRGEGEPGRPSGHCCARPRRRQYARRRQWRRIQSRAGIGGAVQLSDHDFVQRNSCSDPNPGMMGATDVFCFSCLKQRDNVSDDSRLLSARSRRWRYQDTSTQR